MNIRVASPTDWDAIVALLQSASLPVADLTPTSTSLFAVCERENGIVGAIALEPRDEASAMIRSLVVAPELRRSGIGVALTEAIESQAIDRGIHVLYLLTDSAEKFFANRGFARIDRALAPVSISSHPQFRSLCPASAAFMCKVLN